MKVNDHGYTSDLITVATTNPERASGFPQMERVGDRLYFACAITRRAFGVWSLEQIAVKISERGRRRKKLVAVVVP